MVLIKINGFEIEFQQKKIKRMHLHVRKDGTILLTAPIRVSNDDIEKFISDESDWLTEHQMRITNICEKKKHRFDDGAIVPVLGQPFVLKVSYGKKSDVAMGPDTILMTVPEDCGFEDREKLMNEFYRGLLKERLSVLIPKWEEITDLHCSGWQTKIMKTRWGTCNTVTHRIWFSVRLGEKSDDLIEYVVLHELAHTLIKNHGQDFKDLLTAYMPDWKERKMRLNSSVC